MVGLLLLALSLQAPPPRTLASPGLTAINIDERVVAFYNEFFAQELAQKSGYRVVTQQEVAAVLGMERQRQLLGCSEASTNCMAELAGALGVDGLVTGSIARLGAGFVVTLKVIGPNDARTLAVRTGRSKDEDALLDWLTEAASAVAQQLKASFSVPGTAADEPELTPLPGKPRRIAREGKLFTELETARYFHAREQGIPEDDAVRSARGLPPRVVDAGVPARLVPTAPHLEPGPKVSAPPAPPPRRVARDGKMLSEAQTVRYLEARAAGRAEAESFAEALTTPLESAVAPAVTLPPVVDGGAPSPLPPGLPRRIARDGKLLSVEETERYFRQKLLLAPR